MSGLLVIQEILKKEQAKRMDESDKMKEIISSLHSISRDIKKIKQPEELLEIKDVVKIVKFHRDWIYRNIRKGEFPPPVKINSASRWYRSDIDAWLESQKAYRVN